MGSFRKAVRRQRPLRMALYGPSGSGKTFTALTVARGLVGAEGKIAVIDTERSSATIYDSFGFDSAPLTHYAHTDYIALIEEAGKNGYDALVIDSMSHAWEAEGGLLSLVEEVKRGQRSDNGIQAWGSPRVKQAEKSLWAAVLDFPGHIIVTMRAKTAYEISKNEQTGKNTVEKLGLAPIQRGGVEYEFDIIGRMDADNTMQIEKARDPEGKLEGRVIAKPGAAFVAELSGWLNKGDTPTADYKKRMLLACEQVAKIMDRPLDDVKREAWQAFKDKVGDAPPEALSNADWEIGIDLTLAMIPDEKQDEQMRRLKRERKKETVTA